MKKKLILGSGSPRRREILADAGFTYVVKTADTNEDADVSDPAGLVEELSLRKAEAVFSGLSQEEKESCLVLGADTVVAMKGMIMGKPADRQDAKRMLKSLSADVHQVYTGVSFVYWNEEGEMRKASFHEMTGVIFYPMEDSEIDDFTATGECDDKAGAYGIQGYAMRFIKEIRGDYHNVVGLPAARIYQELKKTGIEII